MTDAFLYDAVRTPFGKYGGALAGTRPDDLAAHVVRTLVSRHPNLDPADIDEVVLGNANGAGEENRNVARMATLLAGLPTSIPGTTVNRLCGSSLDAVIIGSRQIALGEADVIIAGGVESMSRAPWVLPKSERPFPAGDATLISTTLGWRLVNPAMDPAWTVSLGEATELLAEREGVTREAQDAFALATPPGRCSGLGRRLLRRPRRPRPGRRPDSRRVHPRRHHAGEVGRIEAGVPQAGRVQCGCGDGDGRQCLDTQRRRVRRDPGQCGGRRDARCPADGPDRGPRRDRPRSAVLRFRTRRSRQSRAQTGRHRLVGRRRGRTQRGLRRPIACLHQRLGHRPGQRQRPRWRDRDRPPARRLRHPNPRDARQGARGARRALGRRGDLHRRRAGTGRRTRERRAPTRWPPDGSHSVRRCRRSGRRDPRRRHAS